MNRIFACTRQPGDWQQFLAQPLKHWKTGYSARTLAHAWQQADGFPPEVARVLASASASEFTAAVPLVAVPEYKIELPGGDRASQTDILVLGTAAGGAFVMAVEGKVSESFGPILKEWHDGASDGKQERWTFLRTTLGLEESVPGDLRYQLFHRAASAVIAARRHHAPLAILLVHSFSTERMGFRDYERFLGLFGAAAEQDRLARLAQLGQTQLYTAWVNGDPKFLAA